MANPRKFSEKIALHNQKQAEETAAFEAILREVSATTRVGAHLRDRRQKYCKQHHDPGHVTLDRILVHSWHSRNLVVKCSQLQSVIPAVWANDYQNYLKIQH